MKFKQESLANRVVLKPLIEKESKGGILIARDERQQAINTDRGSVVMVGPSAWFDMPVKPVYQEGDLVMYAKWGAKVVKDEDTGEFYILCNDVDILVGYTND